MGKLRVSLKPDNKVVELEVGEDGVTVAELLRRLGLSLESAVVVVGGRVLPEWERVKAGSEVLVIRAVSGG